MSWLFSQAMGKDEDLADKISSRELTVCLTCATEKQIVVAELAQERVDNA